MSDDFLQVSQSDEDFTEPFFGKFIRLFAGTLGLRKIYSFLLGVMVLGVLLLFGLALFSVVPTNVSPAFHISVTDGLSIPSRHAYIRFAVLVLASNFK